MLSFLGVWCVFCLFIPFISVLSVFHRKNLVLLHLIKRLLQVSNFWKEKTLWKVNFWYSCYEHITGGADIYLYGCVSLLAHECVVCVCVCLCVCMISNQSTSKKRHMSEISKLDSLLHKTRNKVLPIIRCQSLTHIDP